VDDAIGRFITYLKSRNLYDQSIIVVTADHGDALANLPGFGIMRKEHSVVLYPEIMRVPLIVHLPQDMRKQLVYDENRLTALTDITPSLYYLLGHGPIRQGEVYGQPIVASSWSELRKYRRDRLLLASDARAAYGILSGDARFFYVTYDSPALSMLFDLERDPTGVENIVTPQLAARYNEQILDELQSVAVFYGYKPDGGSSGKFSWDRPH
jgi:arylsulfatase A-like enzyme